MRPYWSLRIPIVPDGSIWILMGHYGSKVLTGPYWSLCVLMGLYECL